MAELRKSKELNDRLDCEARALRNRIRSVDAENSSLQLSVSNYADKDKNLWLKTHDFASLCNRKTDMAKA